MGIYTGAEIFQMAMELEEAGRVFYETIAENSEDHDLACVCRDLAAQEATHYEKFKHMGEQLVERPAYRPLTWDELNFANLLIEERVLSNAEDARDAAGSADIAGILDTAIRLEKDSVLFYNELLAEVEEADAPAVREIIEEEKRHVRSLVEAKRGLSS